MAQDTTPDTIIRKISQIPIQDIPVDSIRTDGKNPNQMTPEQFQGLVQHIKDNGIINPILCTGGGCLLMESTDSERQRSWA